MNTVGPYHNRQETYGYFSLPFCAGPKESISHYHETLGEALQVKEELLTGSVYFRFINFNLIFISRIDLSYGSLQS